MSQMVEQMARLIGNRLAGGEAIALPEIGSLQVVFHAAQRLSKRTVQPPYRSVEFSSEAHGRSLPDLIAQIAACDAATGRTVYDRWVAQVRDGERLTIAGVGTLNHKHFVVDPEFDRRLNPQGRKPVQLRRRRRFDWVLALGIVAIVLAAAGFGAACYLSQSDGGAPEPTVSVVRPVPVETQPAVSVGDPAAEEPVAMPSDPEMDVAAAEEPVAEQPVTEPEQPEDYTRMQSGHFYVVSGVFSTRENAEHARQHFAAQQPDWSYRIYLFGNKFLLSCFATDSEEEARNYVRRHRNQFPDLWVHAAR